MKILYTIIGTLLLGLFLSAPASAQSWEEIDQLDNPLENQKIWEKLEKDPINKRLWKKYFAKKQSEMNMEELEKMNHWKQILMLRSLLRLENIPFDLGFGPESMGDGFFIDDFAYKELVRKYK